MKNELTSYALGKLVLCRGAAFRVMLKFNEHHNLYVRDMVDPELTSLEYCEGDNSELETKFLLGQKGNHQGVQYNIEINTESLSPGVHIIGFQLNNEDFVIPERLWVLERNIYERECYRHMRSLEEVPHDSWMLTNKSELARFASCVAREQLDIDGYSFRAPTVETDQEEFQISPAYLRHILEAILVEYRQAAIFGIDKFSWTIFFRNNCLEVCITSMLKFPVSHYAQRDLLDDLYSNLSLLGRYGGAELKIAVETREGEKLLKLEVREVIEADSIAAKTEDVYEPVGVSG